jgi:HEAT repeat protein
MSDRFELEPQLLPQVVVETKSIQALLAALHDPSFIVRESAIDELDELQAVASLPALANLLQDPDPDVREAARTAYDHLAPFG